MCIYDNSYQITECLNEKWMCGEANDYGLYCIRDAVLRKRTAHPDIFITQHLITKIVVKCLKPFNLVFWITHQKKIEDEKPALNNFDMRNNSVIVMVAAISYKQWH